MIETDCKRALKTIKNELIEDRLCVGKKIASAKMSIELLLTKVKIVEQAQHTLIDSSSSTCIGSNQERSHSLEDNSALSGEKVEEISKKMATLEDSISVT